MKTRKKPPKKIREELKQRGYTSFEWRIVDEEMWFSYCKQGENYFLVTVAAVTGICVVEVLKQQERFDVAT